jgi:hypothetical protein
MFTRYFWKKTYMLDSGGWCESRFNLRFVRSKPQSMPRLSTDGGKGIGVEQKKKTSIGGRKNTHVGL